MEGLLKGRTAQLGSLPRGCCVRALIAFYGFSLFRRFRDTSQVPYYYCCYYYYHCSTHTHTLRHLNEQSESWSSTRAPHFTAALPPSSLKQKKKKGREWINQFQSTRRVEHDGASEEEEKEEEAKGNQLPRVLLLS